MGFDIGSEVPDAQEVERGIGTLDIAQSGGENEVRLTQSMERRERTWWRTPSGGR